LRPFGNTPRAQRPRTHRRGDRARRPRRRPQPRARAAALARPGARV